MNRSLPRDVLYVALSASSLAFLLFPSLDVVQMKGLILLLFFAEVGESSLRGWKSGHLRMTLRELSRNPPRSDPLELLAIVLGVVAVFRILPS